MHNYRGRQKNNRKDQQRQKFFRKIKLINLGDINQEKMREDTNGNMAN